MVGCGLGADAEYVASLGFDTTGFDISGTAIQLARQRFPGSTVRYVVADLLNYPQAWLRAYDLVIEIITVQALLDPPRRQAIANVGRLVGPGGTLLAVTREPGQWEAPDVQERTQTTSLSRLARRAISLRRRFIALVIGSFPPR